MRREMEMIAMIIYRKEGKYESNRRMKEK